jgi:putative pyruvate formate lyase activating enzyme
LELLDGLVDIYLADFKLWKTSSAKRLLKADNYTETAKESIKEMHRQVGDLCFTPDGIAKKGVLVRHLVMPGLEEKGREIVKWLAGPAGPGRDLYINIMEQYHPDAHVGKPKRTGRSRVATGPDETSPVIEPGGDAPESVRVRYADINRPVQKEEVSSVRTAAEEAGLWRFADPPAHGGFI